MASAGGGHSWVWISLSVVLAAVTLPNYILNVGSKRGLPTLVKVSLHCGGNPNTRDFQFSATPLAYAAAGGHTDAVRLLLDAGAHPSPVSRLAGPGEVHQTTGGGQGPGPSVLQLMPVGSMPVHYAAEGGHADAVKLLLERGVPVDARTSAGATALILGAKHFDVVKLLVEAGADVNAQAADGTTPLIAVAALGSAAEATWLLVHGASATAADAAGVTPLHLAAERGLRELAEIMVAHGANPLARDRDKVTPLMLCCGDDANLGLARSLVAHAEEQSEHGRALVTAKSKTDQVSALHVAARAGAADVVAWLLAKGADPNARDARGGHRNVVALLVAAGALVALPDHAANTSLQRAQSHGARLVAQADPRNHAALGVNPTTQY